MSYKPVQVAAGLVILVGPPAAGKSTFVQELIRARKISQDTVASTDSIRKEFVSNAIPPGRATPPSEAIVSERDRRLLSTLAAGHTALAESTNVTRASRERLIALARHCNVTVTMLRFAQTRQVLLQQNAERTRTDVPDTAVMDLAVVMAREASRRQLYADGATFIHDVPGRGQGFTASQAAQLFTFNTPSEPAQPSAEPPPLEQLHAWRPWPRHVTDRLNDGMEVFALPKRLTRALASASPADLAELAGRWTTRLRSADGDDMSDDDLLAVLQAVARLAASAVNTGGGLCSWTY